MRDSNDKTYYAGRAERERTLADRAADAGIRKIHAEMAERYELLAIGEGSSPALRQMIG